VAAEPPQAFGVWNALFLFLRVQRLAFGIAHEAQPLHVPGVRLSDIVSVMLPASSDRSRDPS
jgi:hypothetical protein